MLDTEGLIQMPVKRIPNSSDVARVWRSQKTPANELMNFCLAQLDLEAQQPRLPALAVKLHTVG